ncbi:MAG: hypothetical protein KGH71_02270 [Candidatus Micrarchaeota archaeon]|nr:hypothetical protein [Candidatus Micrarchaeota archaeon]
MGASNKKTDSVSTQHILHSKTTNCPFVSTHENDLSYREELSLENRHSESFGLIDTL